MKLILCYLRDLAQISLTSVLVISGLDQNVLGRLQRLPHVVHQLLQRILLALQSCQLSLQTMHCSVTTLRYLVHHLIDCVLQDLQCSVLGSAESVLHCVNIVSMRIFISAWTSI